jgi:hypothetical protein
VKPPDAKFVRVRRRRNSASPGVSTWGSEDAQQILKSYTVARWGTAWSWDPADWPIHVGQCSILSESVNR